MENILNNLNIQKTKFINKTVEAKDTITFRFQIPENMTWVPGSHFHLAFPDFLKKSSPNKNLVRSFSILSLENEQYISFTTRVKENCSLFKKRLRTLESGDDMYIFKVGNNIEYKSKNNSLVFISMGVGLATFRPIIKECLSSKNFGNKITNINIDSSRDYLFKDEIESFDNTNFTNLYVESRKDLYKQIDSCLKDRDCIYYIVGSDNFIKNIISYLRESSVDKEQIILDKNESKLGEFF